MLKKSFLAIAAVFAVLGLTLIGCINNPKNSSDKNGHEYPEAYNNYSDNTKRLYNYLADNYGKNIISGQMDTAWATNSRIDMIARVYADTEKYPAIKGFDFIDLPFSWGGYGQNEIDEAIEWWNGTNRMRGDTPAKKLLPDKPDIRGIVTFCWHWRAGEEYQFYTNQTSYRIPMKDGKLDTAHENFQEIIEDLDEVAALLKQLKDRDIPILWRPLHEAAGNFHLGQPGWFWWGASGPEANIALWEFMYDYLTNEKKLNNLIWVWNGQHKNWFPDPKTVHIVGYDHYAPAKNYSSQKLKFNEALNMIPDRNRMIALSENGSIPDPDNCKRDGAMWSWFMVWNDHTDDENVTNNNNFWSGEYHNTRTHKNYIYNHELVITLDELPDLTKYRIE